MSKWSDLPRESLERSLDLSIESGLALAYTVHELRRLVPTVAASVEDEDGRVEAGAALWYAVTEIWRHTEKHTTYVAGVGYTSRSDQQTCHDPEEHQRLAADEGRAWHEYRDFAFSSPSNTAFRGKPGEGAER